ncbi:MAG: ABC transporter ATP-binding protein [Clostridia bacterium]|nr:ABC transporter ATP-binding protein [Clostridia bacterium]
MGKEPLLMLSHINKTYMLGELPFQVLHDVSFSVEEGEFVSILGPSGSGKSTLMNIIGCLDTANSGVYRLRDKEVSDISESQLAQIRNREIGFVFQNFQLLTKISAVENVMLPLVYARCPRKERYERAMSMLAKVGLENKAQNTPLQLSGGQMQRVAIARALVTQPAILLADEPTGALDQKTGEQIMELFSSLHDEGKTIVMITHSHKISSYAKRVVHIVDGHLYSEEEYKAMLQE